MSLIYVAYLNIYVVGHSLCIKPAVGVFVSPSLTADWSAYISLRLVISDSQQSISHTATVVWEEWRIDEFPARQCKLFKAEGKEGVKKWMLVLGNCRELFENIFHGPCCLLEGCWAKIIKSPISVCND